MIALIDQEYNIYHCFITPLESDKMPVSPPQAELKDYDTRNNLEKRVKLEVGKPECGDADWIMDGDSFDKAKLIRLIINERQYQRLCNQGDISPRLPYGDLFVSVHEDLSPFDWTLRQ